MTDSGLLVRNVSECYLAVFAPSLLVTVYWCTMCWSVTLRSSPRGNHDYYTLFCRGILQGFKPSLLITVAVTQCVDGGIINNRANCI